MSLDMMDRALGRASGAPLIPGNEVRLLRDASENYPAWLDAIATARRTIHFESYIIHDDEVGLRFAEALAARAAAGVRVRLIYDWLGAVGKTSRRFWRSLRAGGVDVRCFNPPSLRSPFGWLERDHRKMLAVDGEIGFVTGLCVGRDWVGDTGRGVEAWRDTGIALRGPAVAELEAAFARMWALTGAPLPSSAGRPRPGGAAGDVAVRVIAGVPGTAGVYRLDQLIAAAARRTLWLTDAYFIGTTAYVQALCAAARGGVDVRLLVPGSSDIWVLRGLSRAGYRPLLEAGVRVYEWNGPMLHAKTAVADGQWARVGSTNLNLQSWIGNWELDVAVEDEGFAAQMERAYVDDLGRATEIVLTAGARVVRTAPRPRTPGARHPGSAGRAAAGAVSIGSAVGAAVTGRRLLGPTEARIMAAAGVLLLVVGALALLWPRVLAIPLGVLAIGLAANLLTRAFWLHRARTAGRAAKPPVSSARRRRAEKSE
ncbi:MAG TPA: phospholipase D-like domain-containing protein [Methylomirabilota bacterium]|jgi:cardiolipin synthase